MIATSASLGVPQIDGKRDCSPGVQSIAEILPMVLAKLLPLHTDDHSAQRRIGRCMHSGHGAAPMVSVRLQTGHQTIL